MDKAEYVERLEQLSTGRSLPECGLWPMSHTTASDRIRTIINKSRPVLLSRNKQDQTHMEDDDRYVFTYAAPRARPIQGPPVVMLLKADSGIPREIAHPFDSGGLSKHERLRRSQAALVSALTFPFPWRPSLALFVAALFDDANSFLLGHAPARRDPLNIADGMPAGEHDPRYFTWEVKTEEAIQLSGRLVAIVLTKDSNGIIRVDDDTQLIIFKRKQRGEILTREVFARPHDVASALFDLYEIAATMRGWV